MDQRPIGVFDSGLGGLTTVKELRKIMPNENIVYFGDTSRVPYGARSKETIHRYARQDIQFLLSRDVKAIIAACGTVSSNLPPETVREIPVPYFDILHPASQAACAATKNGRIGVIATSATIKSGAFPKTIRTIMNSPVIIGKACPLFVPLVENGYIAPDNPVTKLVAEEYLSFVKNEQVDTLILGCTHYPLIQSIVAQIMGEQVALINSGEEAAKQVCAVLTKEQLLNIQQEDGNCRFYVSDDADSFSEVAGVFLQDDIQGSVEQIKIEDYE